MRDTWWARTLRIVGIAAMSLTALFTLMGGAGTTCVALDPNGFGGSFSGIAPFQWLYILFVIVTLAIGVLGVRAAVLLVRGTSGAYGQALLALVAGAVVGVIHIVASRSLRGGSMPVDMVVYVTGLTLIVFLLFRIPGVWRGVNFERPAGGKPTGRQATAVALGACGLLALTIQFLMAPTHTIGGINYADVWHVALTLTGATLLVAAVLAAIYTERLPGRRLAAESR